MECFSTTLSQPDRLICNRDVTADTSFKYEHIYLLLLFYYHCFLFDSFLSSRKYWFFLTYGRDVLHRRFCECETSKLTHAVTQSKDKNQFLMSQLTKALASFCPTQISCWFSKNSRARATRQHQWDEVSWSEVRHKQASASFPRFVLSWRFFFFNEPTFEQIR